jgi:hypothetical protein
MSTEQQSEKTAEEYFKDGLAFSKLGDDRKTFESYKKLLNLTQTIFWPTLILVSDMESCV